VPLEQFERQVYQGMDKARSYSRCIEIRDDDNDPFGQMMEDLLEEMKDFEAEKCQKCEDKKNSEESLVAEGGGNNTWQSCSSDSWWCTSCSWWWSSYIVSIDLKLFF
jgi:hypothetical protein